MNIGKLEPAIQKDWPKSAPRNTTWIQKDNAKPHILSDETEFNEALKRTGFKIKCFVSHPIVMIEMFMI